MKRMLISASQREEIQVALVDNHNKLYDLDIEQKGNQNKVGNIYKGRITKVEASLEACFVHYGNFRDGFLPFKSITSDYLSHSKEAKNELYVGQEIIVQVNKEERGNKGANLTTNVAIVAPYVVLLPKSPTTEGISRKINDEGRTALKSKLEKLELPEDFGVIIRTAGKAAQENEIKNDYANAYKQWLAVVEFSKTVSTPSLLLAEDDIIQRSLRDYLDVETEIVVDNQDVLVSVKEYLRINRPEFKNKLILHRRDDSLFNYYGIERQIEECYEREVNLPSGGALVFDTTEALTAIDVNSARYTGGDNVESTALNTNLEAADEIARQLRLRDLGGLIVVDFIDMSINSNRKQVEDRFNQAIRSDRAKVSCEKIGKFGLLEASRQRIRPPLTDTNHNICTKCNGTGRIRDLSSTISLILRNVQDTARKSNTAQVQVFVPVQISSILMNEKRQEILKIEKDNNIIIVIVPQTDLESTAYHIYRARPHEVSKDPSYKLRFKTKEKPDNKTPTRKNAAVVEESVSTENPEEAPRIGFFSVLISYIKSIFASRNEKVEDELPKGKNSKFSKNKNNKPRKALTKEPRTIKPTIDKELSKEAPAKTNVKIASVKEMVNAQKQPRENNRNQRNKIEKKNSELTPKDFLDQSKIDKVNEVNTPTAPKPEKQPRKAQPRKQSINTTAVTIVDVAEKTVFVEKPKRERPVKEKRAPRNSAPVFSLEAAIGRAVSHNINDPKIRGKIRAPHKLIADPQSVARWSKSNSANPQLSDYDWQESPTLVALSELEKQELDTQKVSRSQNKSKIVKKNNDQSSVRNDNSEVITRSSEANSLINVDRQDVVQIDKTNKNQYSDKTVSTEASKKPISIKTSINHVSQQPTKTQVPAIDYDIKDINLKEWDKSTYSYVSRRITHRDSASSMPTKV